MSQTVVITLSENATAPTYAHEGDAGADLYAAQAVRIAPLDWRLVSTGIQLQIPYGFVGLIHPRSGLALRNGVTVLNAPGTIDAGYRGDVGVVLYNGNPFEDFIVNIGDRIAQFVLQSVEEASFVGMGALVPSDRGDGGFGSTGA